MLNQPYLNQPFILPALLFLILALPLIAGIVPPNRIYGIRTANTIANPHHWYRANRYGGIIIIISSLTYLLIAALLNTIPSTRGDILFWLLHLSAFLTPLIIGIRRIQHYIQNL